MTAINAWAKELGFKAVEARGSGISAKSFPPPVSATELQTITLVLADGSRHEIGKVLPEGKHLKELKSTAELVNEMKQLVIEFGQR